MDFGYAVPIICLKVLVLVFQGSSAQPVLSVTPPQQQTVRLRSTARFPCQVESQGATLQFWSRLVESKLELLFANGQRVPSNFAPSRYRVITNTTPGFYELTINNASREDSGLFVCQVGDAEKANSTLVVTAPPLNPTLDLPVLIKEHDQVLVSCSVDGAEPKARLEVVVTDRRLDNIRKAESQALYGMSRVSGTLRVTRADDGRRISCEASSPEPHWPVPSSASRPLNVQYAPSVELSVSQLAVLENRSATANCSCNSNPPPAPSRWYRDKQLLPETGSLLRLAAVQEHDSGARFTCSCSNTLGSSNSSLLLTVLRAPTVSVVSSSTFREHQEAEVKCLVDGEPRPNVSWYRNAVLVSSTDTLHFDAVKRADTANYTCTATSILRPTNGEPVQRTASAVHELRVQYTPGNAVITSLPFVRHGQNLTLRCQVKDLGEPAGSYEWRRNGSLIATSRKYTLRNARFADEALFSCRARNSLGAGAEDAQTLTVFEPLTWEKKFPSRSEKQDAVSTPFSLTCAVRSRPEAVITWYRDDRPLSADGRWYRTQEARAMSGYLHHLSSTLLFFGESRRNESQLVPDDRGVYSCRAFSPADVFPPQRHSGALYVRYSPSLSPNATQVHIRPSPLITVLGCVSEGYPLPNLTWWRQGAQITEGNGVTIATDLNHAQDQVRSKLYLANAIAGQITCRAESNVPPAVSSAIYLLPPRREAATASGGTLLTRSQLIGIVVGVSAVLVALMVAVLLYLLCHRRRATELRKRSRDKPRGRATPIALAGETSDSSGELLQSPELAPKVQQSPEQGHLSTFTGGQSRPAPKLYLHDSRGGTPTPGLASGSTLMCITGSSPGTSHAATPPVGHTDVDSSGVRRADSCTGDSEESGYTTDTPPKKRVIYEVVV